MVSDDDGTAAGRGPVSAYGATGTEAVREVMRAHFAAHPGLHYQVSGWRVMALDVGHGGGGEGEAGGGSGWCNRTMGADLSTEKPETRGTVGVRFDFVRRCDAAAKHGAGTETLVLDSTRRFIKRIDVIY